MKTLRFSPVCFHNPAVADTWLYPLADLRRVKAGKSLSLFATDFFGLDPGTAGKTDRYGGVGKCECEVLPSSKRGCRSQSHDNPFV